MLTHRLAIAAALGGVLGVAACTAEAQMRLRVDAIEIDRSLLHAQLDLPARPGAFGLHYVEWLPGNHNPSGPIWNVVDFFVRDADGATLEWDRDPRDPFRIVVRIPEGVDAISARYTYIANQPWVNSESTDSYGRPGYGGINWNTVTFYPGGVDKDEFIVEPTLILPEGWTVATDLPLASSASGAFDFESVSLAQLIDSPVIFGAPGQIRTYELPVDSPAKFYFHGAAPRSEYLELPDSRQHEIARMIEQTHKVFGPYPHDAYHFLTLLGDDLPGFGVEHHTSTFIDMSNNEWIESGGPNASSMGVVPHEYIHVWCGKLCTPKGLHGRDFHTDGDAGLLWVYEGVTSYYDSIVSVRGGLTDAEEYYSSFLRTIERYALQTGRGWRSVEDTARAQRHLRAPRSLWSDRIRRQDYYAEGALFWMLADATIRRGTDGERSLDDWALAFHSVPFEGFGSPFEYTRDDIVQSLAEIYSGADWSDLIHRYIESPGSTITDDLPPLLGYRVVTNETPGGEVRGGHSALVLRTLGFSLTREGQVRRLLAGSPADEAGMAYSMRIVAVNGATFSMEALASAIEASTRTGGVTLLVEWGERVFPIEIGYGGGARHLELERIDGEPDLIEAILEPR